MVNDLLKELYQNIIVPHMVRLGVGALTIDKYLLSEVIDFAPQIRNVGFPGSVDSPENPGFMASLGPGSVDSSALIEWTTVLQS